MTRRAHLPLAIALASSLLAMARSFDDSVFLGLSLIALLTAAADVRLDPSIDRLARLLARFGVVAAVLAGWALAIAPMLHGERTDDVLRTMGFVLAGCALPLAIARPRADLAVMLCGMGLFGLAGLHRLAEIRPFIAVAGLACIGHALATTRAPIRRALLPVSIAALIATTIVFGLPPAQRRIERALLSGRVIELKGRSGLSTEDVRIGELQSLALSDRPVLRVYGARAVRLRAHLFSRFDGRVWHAVHEVHPNELAERALPVGPRALELIERMPGALRPFPGVSPELLAGDNAIASRIEPIDLDEGLILTPSGALAVKTANEVHVDSLGLLIRSDRRLPEPYAVVHHRNLVLADMTVPTPESRALALSLPRRIDPRVREVADRLARPDGAALDAPMLGVRARIQRTEAFLRNAARYTTQTPAYKTNDVVAELLFEHRAGYCEHFATALAVLLRLEGVPARYVTGFRFDENDREGEHYLVRDEHAHAWVEAWVDGVGWIEADGTPMTEPTMTPRTRGLGAELRAFFADLRAAIRYGRTADVFARLKWPLAIALSIVGLGYVARNEIRRRFAEARSSITVRERERLPAELEALTRAIDSAFRGSGHPRPRSSGLLEHAALLDDKGIDPTRSAAIRDAIELVHRAAFGGEEPSRDVLRELRARLTAPTRRTPS